MTGFSWMTSNRSSDSWLRNQLTRINPTSSAVDFRTSALLRCGNPACQPTPPVGSATRGTSNAPELMMFLLARSGDLAYEVVLNYHAVDGSVNFGADAVQDGG